MKNQPIFHCRTVSRLSLLSAAVLSGSLLAQPSAAAEGNRNFPAAAELANPESKPLKDRSKKASRESEPTKDRSKEANPESEPTKDRSKEANPESEPTKDRSKDANPESEPVEESEEKEKPGAAEDDEAGQGKVPAKPAREGQPPKETLPKPPAKTKPGGKPGASQDQDPAIAPGEEKPGRRDRAKGEPQKQPEAPPVAPEMTPETAPEPTLEILPEEPPVPPTEEAKEAEAEVQRATAEVETKIAERKLRIENKGQAKSLIEDILGKASPLSRAEVTREQRSGLRRPGREGQPGRDPVTEVSREQRRAAADFLRNRLRGEAEAREAPEFFFRREARPQDGDRRNGRPDPQARDRAPQRVAAPRYLHQGRRYVHFESRASVPAILLATVALDRLRMQPARELNPVFFGGNPAADTLPPEEYRSDNAWVVSYPVNEQSMISSNDILFRQGSTQFADGHSYDMLEVLSDAMNDPALSSARFIIEGHASAEGSYDENMALSQRRAEAIVREMVRSGIPPERLIPVGYGESEARHRDNAPEALRAQDRRVVVFRMDDTPVAGR